MTEKVKPVVVGRIRGPIPGRCKAVPLATNPFTVQSCAARNGWKEYGIKPTHPDCSGCEWFEGAAG